MNIFTELRKCCKLGSRRRYTDSFTRCHVEKDPLHRTHSATVPTVVQSTNTTSNGKIQKFSSLSQFSKDDHAGYIQCSVRDQLTRSNLSTGLAKYTSNQGMRTSIGGENSNQNNNVNIYIEAVKKLNANWNMPNGHLIFNSSMSDSETESGQEDVPMIVLNN